MDSVLCNDSRLTTTLPSHKRSAKNRNNQTHMNLVLVFREKKNLLFVFDDRGVFGCTPHKIHTSMYRRRDIQIQPEIEYYNFIFYDKLSV